MILKLICLTVICADTVKLIFDAKNMEYHIGISKKEVILHLILLLSGVFARMFVLFSATALWLDK